MEQKRTICYQVDNSNTQTAVQVSPFPSVNPPTWRTSPKGSLVSVKPLELRSTVHGKDPLAIHPPKFSMEPRFNNVL